MRSAQENTIANAPRRIHVSDDTERAGLGKVIYSVDENDDKTPREERAEQNEVEEADKESFPASDPPGYAGGAKQDSS